MPKRKIYMAVTKDALSLPLAVADSAAELAELRGVQVEIHTILNFQREDGKDQASPDTLLWRWRRTRRRRRRARRRRRRRAAGAGRAENLTGRYSGRESDYCGRKAA